MKNSTVLVVGTLGLVGAYLYLKGKKTTMPISNLPTSTNTTSNTSSVANSPLVLPTATTNTSNTSSVANSPLVLPTATTNTSNTSSVVNTPLVLPTATTNTSNTSSIVNSSLGLPTATTNTSNTSSIVNSSLGLPSTTTTTSDSTDEQKKYLEAKDLARLIFLYNANTQNDEFKLLSTKYQIYPNVWDGSRGIPDIILQRISALGYKLLSNFDVENTITSTKTVEQKNYLEAKDLARILFLNYTKVLNQEYKWLTAYYGVKVDIFSQPKIPSVVSSRINALGYKVLPNYDIENFITTAKTPEEKNYLEAKYLARILLLYNAKLENDEFKLLTTYYGVKLDMFSKPKIPSIVSSRINALGYKVLPNYDIEKM